MNNPIGTWTMFKRENKRFMKVWLQTLLAPVINNLLYFAVFGIALHRAVMDIEGVGYLEFLVPGLIMMGLINNAYQNPSSSLIMMKYQGLISDLMTLPLKKYEILLSYTGSAVVRALVVGAVTFITATFFVDFNFYSITIAVVSMVLVAFFFAFLGIFMGIWADEFDKQASFQNFLLTPLTFLGGVFYPTSTLPEFVQQISHFNPIFHMVNLCRYGFTGLAEFSIIYSAIIVSTLTLVMGLICFFVLRSGWKLQN